MENMVNVEMLEKNRSLLIGRIFTKIQFTILMKKLRRTQLSPNEKTYYYKFIKPKVIAMMAFFGIGDLNIRGKEDMLSDRLEKAIQIMKKMEKKHKNQKIILSGSFLFNKKYNDIDVFIFSRYERPEYRKGKIHVSFLPKTALNSIFFCSLCKISISNFAYSPKQDFKFDLKSILQDYELLVNSILNKDEHSKYLRDFIMKTEYISRGVILDPKQLYDINSRLSDKTIEILSGSFISSLILSYDSNILKTKLKNQILNYQKLLLEYKSAKNIPIYIDTYSKVISLAG